MDICCDNSDSQGCLWLKLLLTADDYGDIVHSNCYCWQQILKWATLGKHEATQEFLIVS